MGDLQKYTSKKLQITVISLMGLFFAPQAQGSLVYQMSPTEMTHEATEVQMGKVVSTWTSPDPVNKMIYTYVKIKVDQTLKGTPKSEILLRQPGGTYTYADNGKTYRQKVFGMQAFQKGEKGIFFIKHAKDGAPSVMFQGKHQIVQNPQNGEVQARQKYSRDVKYVDQNLKTVKGKHGSFAKEEVRKLGDLIDEINSAVEKENKGENATMKH